VKILHAVAGLKELDTIVNNQAQLINSQAQLINSLEARLLVLESKRACNLKIKYIHYII